MIEAKSAVVDPHPPYLRLVCPECGERLPLTPAGMWALCLCRERPITARELGTAHTPASSNELEPRRER